MRDICATLGWNKFPYLDQPEDVGHRPHLERGQLQDAYRQVNNNTTGLRHLYTHTYAHAHTLGHIHTHSSICTHIYTHPYAHALIYIHLSTYTHAHTLMHS